jgi:hypothetical protein
MVQQNNENPAGLPGPIQWIVTLLLVILFIGSLLWSIFSPGFEPILVCLGSLITLLTTSVLFSNAYFNSVKAWRGVAIALLFFIIVGVAGAVLFWPDETTDSVDYPNVLWPSDEDVSLYVDFERDNDLESWTAGIKSSLALSSEEAFTGTHSVAVTTYSDSSDDNQRIFWNHTIRGEALIGQVYWPSQRGVNLEWALACLWDVCELNFRTFRPFAFGTTRAS